MARNSLPSFAFDSAIAHHHPIGTEDHQNKASDAPPIPSLTFEQQAASTSTVVDHRTTSNWLDNLAPSNDYPFDELLSGSEDIERILAELDAVDDTPTQQQGNVSHETAAVVGGLGNGMWLADEFARWGMLPDDPAANTEEALFSGRVDFAAAPLQSIVSDPLLASSAIVQQQPQTPPPPPPIVNAISYPTFVKPMALRRMRKSSKAAIAADDMEPALDDVLSFDDDDESPPSSPASSLDAASSPASMPAPLLESTAEKLPARTNQQRAVSRTTVKPPRRSGADYARQNRERKKREYQDLLDRKRSLEQQKARDAERTRVALIRIEEVKEEMRRVYAELPADLHPLVADLVRGVI